MRHTNFWGTGFLTLALAGSLAGCGGNQPSHLQGGNSAGDGGGHGASLATLEIPADHPVGGDFTAVTDTFGPLEVTEGEFEAESSIKPWSAYWYPINKPFLFQGASSGDSPLEKYDAFVKKTTNGDSQAANFERENIFRADAESWAGLCDAWALASIMAPEPRNPVHVQDIEFKVGDLKALLLKTFEGIQGLKRFGQRNDDKWNSNFADIYPDQFHRFMQVELFDKKMPFIMDHDPGIEVWNTPVWKAQLRITAEPGKNNVRHVKVWVFTASPNVEDVNYVGTMQVTRDYEYDLFGTQEPNGKFRVAYGEWAGRSKWDHPDFVIERPDHIERKSLNNKIDPKMVDAILGPSNVGLFWTLL